MKQDEKQAFWVGKRVLVTGGTSGLGRALALRLVAAGAKVAVVSRRGGAPSAGIGAIRGDLSSKAEIHRVAAEAHLALGGIDALFNNASSLGPVPLRPLLDTECEDFEGALQANLLGPFRLTKAVLPGMVLHGGGVVINVSSDAAVSAYPAWGAYGSSKAALAHLTRIWAEETRSQGIRFLAVDPGDMDTPMHAAAIPDADRSQLRDPDESAREILERVARGEAW